jgi:hypothetical protein
MCGPFPGLDIKRISRNRDEQIDFHADLDVYLGDVAGYSSCPERLHRRSSAELAKAQKFLAGSFFDHYPEHESYRYRITREATPDLYDRLRVAEMNRSDLVVLISDIVNSV